MRVLVLSLVLFWLSFSAQALLLSEEISLQVLRYQNLPILDDLGCKHSPLPKRQYDLEKYMVTMWEMANLHDELVAQYKKIGNLRDNDFRFLRKLLGAGLLQHAITEDLMKKDFFQSITTLRFREYAEFLRKTVLEQLPTDPIYLFLALYSNYVGESLGSSMILPTSSRHAYQFLSKSMKQDLELMIDEVDRQLGRKTQVARHKAYQRFVTKNFILARYLGAKNK